MAVVESINLATGIVRLVAKLLLFLWVVATKKFEDIDHIYMMLRCNFWDDLRQKIIYHVSLNVVIMRKIVARKHWWWNHCKYLWF